MTKKGFAPLWVAASAMILLSGMFLWGQEPVEITRTGDQIAVEIGGTPFTTYYFGPQSPKPYLSPLRSAQGTIVTRGWPMVTDVADTFYARPEPGGLLLSPADATPMMPGRARHDDTDVALAIARFEAMVALPLRHVSHAWAGLRTAAPDDTPVIGPDPDAPGFCWLAGLGGYGIQTAPAAGALLAALAAGDAPPTALRPLAADVTPARTRTAPL